MATTLQHKWAVVDPKKKKALAKQVTSGTLRWLIPQTTWHLKDLEHSPNCLTVIMFNPETMMIRVITSTMEVLVKKARSD